MPFITQERRKIIDEQGLEGLDVIQPGDLCYVYYKQMVDRWKANPRWTTAHRIYKDLHEFPSNVSPDQCVAKDLAWQVFFQIYVMPYEEKKRAENGDI